jgi:hypothetical protein
MLSFNSLKPTKRLDALSNMDHQMILKDNLEDLPDDQKALIEQAVEEFWEKWLMSYSRKRSSVVKKTPLPSVLLHGQSEDVEVRTTALWSTRLSMKPLQTTTRCWPIWLVTFWKRSSLERQLIKLGQYTLMAWILRLWEATYLVLVNSRMVGSSSSH